MKGKYVLTEFGTVYLLSSIEPSCCGEQPIETNGFWFTLFYRYDTSQRNVM